jgi:hypothetical protein
VPSGNGASNRRAGTPALAAVLAALLAVPGPAGAAKPPPRPPAKGAAPANPSARAAADLFEKGKKLLDEGNIGEACETLARSDLLDPTVGALGMLALCHEKQGRLATAHAEYTEAARRARAAKDDREYYALGRAAKLEPDVPRLTVLVRERAPDLGVLRDRKPLAETEIGVETFVDPGEIEILAHAPGRRSWATTLSIAKGERRTVEIPALESIDGKPYAPPPPSDQLIIAAVAGTLGVVGLGVMAGFGIAAKVQDDESKDLEQRCVLTTDAACGEGQDLREAAQTAATVSTIGLAVGVAGLAAGTVLFLTAPSASEEKTSARLCVAPAVGPQGGGVLLRATF